MKRILAVDDDQMVLDVLTSIVQRIGHHLTTTTDPEEAITLAGNQQFDLVIIDICMPRRNGAEVVEEILTARSEQRTIITTGYPHDPRATRALEAGARALLEKPYDMTKLLSYIEG